MTVADTSKVRELLDAGAQVVEVLPASEWRREHLPGAVNLPLPRLRASAASSLDPARPTVVYCYDHECDLSARGARLLEQLGFRDVYDYAGSKTAWLAEGLPVEGEVAPEDRAGARATRPPTCPPDATIGDVTRRADRRRHDRRGGRRRRGHRRRCAAPARSRAFPRPHRCSTRPTRGPPPCDRRSRASSSHRAWTTTGSTTSSSRRRTVGCSVSSGTPNWTDHRWSSATGCRARSTTPPHSSSTRWPRNAPGSRSRSPATTCIPGCRPRVRRPSCGRCWARLTCATERITLATGRVRAAAARAPGHPRARRVDHCRDVARPLRARPWDRRAAQ